MWQDGLAFSHNWKWPQQVDNSLLRTVEHQNLTVMYLYIQMRGSSIYLAHPTKLKATMYTLRKHTAAAGRDLRSDDRRMKCDYVLYCIHHMCVNSSISICLLTCFLNGIICSNLLSKDSGSVMYFYWKDLNETKKYFQNKKHSSNQNQKIPYRGIEPRPRPWKGHILTDRLIGIVWTGNKLVI